MAEISPIKASDLPAIIDEAREYLADAMRQPTEEYAPAFAAYVAEGMQVGSAGVKVDTALTAIAFAIMAERMGAR